MENEWKQKKDSGYAFSLIISLFFPGQHYINFGQDRKNKEIREKERNLVSRPWPRAAYTPTLSPIIRKNKELTCGRVGQAWSKFLHILFLFLFIVAQYIFEHCGDN